LFTRCGPPLSRAFDFLTLKLSQADIGRLPLKYLLRHLLNRFSEKLMSSDPNPRTAKRLRLDSLIALLALADEVIH